MNEDLESLHKRLQENQRLLRDVYSRADDAYDVHCVLLAKAQEIDDEIASIKAEIAQSCKSEE